MNKKLIPLIFIIIFITFMISACNQRAKSTTSATSDLTIREPNKYLGKVKKSVKCYMYAMMYKCEEIKELSRISDIIVKTRLV